LLDAGKTCLFVIIDVALLSDISISYGISHSFLLAKASRETNCFFVLQWFLELPESNGFLIIEANGGLNQQRLSVCFVF